MREIEDLPEVLESYGLTYYDPMEMLFRSKEKYCGDDLLVVPYVEPKTISFNYINVTNVYPTVKGIVYNVAANNHVLIDEIEVDIATLFRSLFPIYLNMYLKKKEEQRKCSQKRAYKGRPKKEIGDDFGTIYEMYKNKEIDIHTALRILGISRSTFIRRIKEYQQRVN